MTREHKLALILGFALVLVVGVLISDHLSGARQATLESILDDSAAEPPLLAAGRPLPTSPQADPGPADGAPEVYASNQTREPEPIAGAPERAATPPASIVTGQPIDDERLALADRADSRASLSVEELRRYAKEQFGIELTPVTPVVGMAGESRQASRDEARQPEPTTRRTNYPAPRLHTVQADETLWSIAQRYFGDGALHARLAAYNRSRLPDPSALRVGLTILIPSKDELTSASDAALAARGAEAKAQTTTSTAAPAPTQSASKPETPAREYVVKKGDTLGEISMATLGTSKRWRELYELNKDRIDDPDNVVVGTRLRLPAK